jgi:hypothetical protein
VAWDGAWGQCQKTRVSLSYTIRRIILIPALWELQPPFIPTSLHDHKRWLNGFELLESMHLLATAREVVLSPGVAVYSKFITSEVSQNHFSCYGSIWPKLCWHIVKPNKTNPHINLPCVIFRTDNSLLKGCWYENTKIELQTVRVW